MRVTVKTVSGMRGAEVLEEKGETVRVRWEDSGQTTWVGRRRVSGLKRGSKVGLDSTPEPKTKAKPEFPKLMTGAELERRQRDAIRPPATRPFQPGDTRPVPKLTPPARSKRYLAFVRAHACVYPGCGKPGPSEASHHGPHAISVKASDFRVIPLCTEDHRGHHAGRRPALTPAFIAEVQRDLLVEFLDLEEAS